MQTAHLLPPPSLINDARVRGEDGPDWNWWSALLNWSGMNTCGATSSIFFTCKPVIDGFHMVGSSWVDLLTRNAPTSRDSYWWARWRRIAAVVNIVQSDIHGCRFVSWSCVMMLCSHTFISSASPLAQNQTVCVIIGPQAPGAPRAAANPTVEPSGSAPRLCPLSVIWLRSQSNAVGPPQHSLTDGVLSKPSETGVKQALPSPEVKATGTSPGLVITCREPPPVGVCVCADERRLSQVLTLRWLSVRSGVLMKWYSAVVELIRSLCILHTEKHNATQMQYRWRHGSRVKCVNEPKHRAKVGWEDFFPSYSIILLCFLIRPPLNGHFVDLEKKIQTLNFNLYNMNKVIIQTKTYLCFP